MIMSYSKQSIHTEDDRVQLLCLYHGAHICSSLCLFSGVGSAGSTITVLWINASRITTHCLPGSVMHGSATVTRADLLLPAFTGEQPACGETQDLY